MSKIWIASGKAKNIINEGMLINNTGSMKIESKEQNLNSYSDLRISTKRECDSVKEKHEQEMRGYAQNITIQGDNNGNIAGGDVVNSTVSNADSFNPLEQYYQDIFKLVSEVKDAVQKDNISQDEKDVILMQNSVIEQGVKEKKNKEVIIHLLTVMRDFAVNVAATVTAEVINGRLKI